MKWKIAQVQYEKEKNFSLVPLACSRRASRVRKKKFFRSPRAALREKRKKENEIILECPIQYYTQFYLICCFIIIDTSNYNTSTSPSSSASRGFSSKVDIVEAEIKTVFTFFFVPQFFSVPITIKIKQKKKRSEIFLTWWFISGKKGFFGQCISLTSPARILFFPLGAFFSLPSSPGVTMRYTK